MPFIHLTYGAYGRLAAIVDTGGAGAVRRTTITINADSDLTVITDPAGGTVSYSYDSNGRLATMTDRRGGVTTLGYDALTWKLASVQAPSIPIDAGGGTTTSASPVTQYTPWQVNGLPTGRTSPTAPATPGPENSRGHIFDPLGRETQLDVNIYGQAVNIIDPAGRTTSISYDYIGGRIPLPGRVNYPSGTADTIWYVSGTPLVSQQRLAGDSLVRYHYGAKAQLDSLSGPGRDTEKRTLDPFTGRILQVRYANSAQLTAYFQYDSMGRDSIYTDPGTHATKYHYDAVTGNTDSVAAVGGRYSVASFDAYGRDTLTRASGVPATQTTYDVLNRVRKVWRDGAPDDTVITTYDSLYPVRVRGPGGQVYKLEVNALGWPTKRYDSGDTTRYQSFRYDKAGRLTSYTNRRSQSIDMSYDALDRLLTRGAGPGVPADTFGYSSDGLRQWSIRKNVSRDTIYLSALGRPDSIVRKIAGHRYAITYAYAATDSVSSRTVTIKNDAGITFSQETDDSHSLYPSLDHVTITGGPGAGTSTLFRNQDDLFENTRWPNDTAYFFYWHFTAQHQLYSIYSTQLGGSNPLLDSLAYSFTYDSTGRVIDDWRLEATGATSMLHRHFAYDSLGQLLKVVFSADSQCTGYDDSLAAGTVNSCASRQIAVQDGATYDVAGNRLFAGAVYSTTGNRLLQGPSGVTYTYDADGNMVTRTHSGITDSLFWSPTGLLDSVASPGLRHWYEYNAYGQLVRRRTKAGSGAYVFDRHLVWDDTQLLAELDDPGTHRRAQYVYYKGVDQPFALITDSAGTSLVRYFFQNPVEGNVTAITRNSTTLHQYSTYSAWGLLQTRPINVLADTNRLGWKGLFYEGDSTRLYYMRSRWYDPATGRFVSEDPIGIAGGMNLYSFAGNNPITMIDPDGRCAYVEHHKYEEDGVVHDDSHQRHVTAGDWIIDSQKGLMYCGCDNNWYSNINDLPSCASASPAAPSRATQPLIKATRECAFAATAFGASFALDVMGAKELGGAVIGLGVAAYRGAQAGIISLLLNGGGAEISRSASKTLARAVGRLGAASDVAAMNSAFVLGGSARATLEQASYTGQLDWQDFLPGVGTYHLYKEAYAACINR